MNCVFRFLVSSLNCREQTFSHVKWSLLHYDRPFAWVVGVVSEELICSKGCTTAYSLSVGWYLDRYIGNCWSYTEEPCTRKGAYIAVLKKNTRVWGGWSAWPPSAMTLLISPLAEAALPTSWNLTSNVQSVGLLPFSCVCSVSHEDFSIRNTRVITPMKLWHLIFLSWIPAGQLRRKWHF